MPCRMFISIGTASETVAPASATFCQAMSDIAGHVDEQVVGPERASAGALVEGRAHAEGAEDVRGDRKAELAADRPGLS